MNADLPPLTWDGYCWAGSIVLPSWRGFQTRSGPYAAMSAGERSDGSARLRFDTGDIGQVPPAETQAAAYQWLIKHEEEITSAILDAVFTEYPQLREDFIDGYSGEDAQAAAQAAPPLASPDQLKLVMGLYAVFILPVAKDGVSYIGFECGCVWDEEHGLGVMTHKDRVIDIGGAYNAFTSHRAREDGGS